MKIYDSKATAVRLQPPRRLKEFHVSGIGSRPNGTSGFAWVKLGTELQHVEWVDGLTENQAAYRALLAALEFVGEGSSVRIHSDSRLVMDEYKYCILGHDPESAHLLAEARAMDCEKELDVDVEWIRRKYNLAAKLLERCK
jgi:ribonuclease HI